MTGERGGVGGRAWNVFPGRVEEVCPERSMTVWSQPVAEGCSPGAFTPRKRRIAETAGRSGPGPSGTVAIAAGQMGRVRGRCGPRERVAASLGRCAEFSKVCEDP
ncbi:hypothetical protein ALMP_36040 [Streptomyces sp. A012304]|nr:hypothetical protein ALMP_36040 [Streptomyces sp. A012304]